MIIRLLMLAPQYSVSITPEIVRKPLAFLGGIEMEYWRETS